MHTTIVFYFFVVLLVLLVSLITGRVLRTLINKIDKDFSFFTAFVDIVVGLTFLVSIYSIVKTGLKSTGWIYLLLLFWYLRKYKTPVKQKLSYKKFLWIIPVFTIPFFLLYLSSVFDFQSKSYTDTFVDWHFYSKTVQFMNLGFESTNQFDNVLFGLSPTPYHYYELWISAVISGFFNIPAQISVTVITPTILAVISLLGVISLFDKFSYKVIVYAFLILSVSPTSFFSSLLSKVGLAVDFFGVHAETLFAYHKLLPALIFSLLALNHYIVNDKKQIIVSLLFLPLANIIFLPIVFPAMFFVILVLRKEFFKRSVFSKSDFLLLVIYILAFGIFYKFLWIASPVKTELKFYELSNYVHTLQRAFVLIVYIFPFALLPFLVGARSVTSNSNFILFLLLSLFLSLTASVFMAGNYDGIQFFTNTIVLVVLVFCAFLFVKYTGERKAVFYILTFLLLSSAFYSVKYLVTAKHNQLEKNFENKVLAEFGINNEEIINCGFIHSKEYYAGYELRVVSKVFVVGGVFDSYRNGLFTIGMSDFTALDYSQNSNSRNKKMLLSRVEEGTFYKYVQNQKLNGTFVSVEDSQLSFAEICNLKYLYVQNNATLPEVFSDKITLVAKETTENGYSLFSLRW